MDDTATSNRHIPRDHGGPSLHLSLSRTVRAAISLAAFLIITSAAGSCAQPATRFAEYSDASIAANGSISAWVATRGSHRELRFSSNRFEALAAALQRITISDPVLSPEGSRVAFLSDAETAGQNELFIGRSDGSMRRLTSLRGDLESIAWSPDGASILMLVAIDAQNSSNPLMAHVPAIGLVGEGHPDSVRLVVVNASSGALRILTPDSENVFEASWAPNAARIVAVVGHDRADFDTWYHSTLDVIDARSGLERVLVHPRFQIAQPTWISTRKIAFLAGLMSDIVSPGGDLYTVDASSGVAQRVLADPGGGTATHLWPCNSHVLCMRLYNGASTALATFDWNSTTFAFVRNSWENITSASADRHGDVIFISESFTHPAYVSLLRGNVVHRLDDENNRGARTWGPPISFCWNSDGRRLCGWLVPPAAMKFKRAPLLVYVHGGPAYNTPPFWPHRWATDVLRDLASDGVALFLPNYRGSFGFGEATTMAIRGQVGRGDARDVITGVQEVAKTKWIDIRRIGIYGNSFGGSIALAAIGQSSIFRVAAVGETVVDWYSYSGQNGIYSELPFFMEHAYYEDPNAYLIASPVFYIKNVTTPTLLLQGDADEEVPTMQPYEFWRALRARGVPTRFRIFKGEGHAYAAGDSRAAFSAEVESWIRTYLLPKK